MQPWKSLCSFSRSAATVVALSSLFQQCQFSSSRLLLTQFRMSDDGQDFLHFSDSIRFPCLIFKIITQITVIELIEI